MYDNINFDSETEKDYYIKLKHLKLDGKILGFETQVPFTILKEFLDFEGTKIPSIDYIIDFRVFLKDGREIFIDTKGDTEEVARLKSKMFMEQNRTLPLYFISILPKYLGNDWVEVTKSKDFRSKLKKQVY